MANKNTNMILAVAVIAVCAIAIIGVGYAYTATTQNSSNTSDVKYITLTQGDNASAYASSFNGKIIYDTTNDAGTVSYIMNEAQATTNVGSAKAIKLGSTTITVDRTNSSENFNFSVTNVAGDMEGTFYIGIALNNGDEKIRAYTVGEMNYYSTAEGNSAVSAAADAAVPINATVIGTSTNTITVSMYYGYVGGTTTLQTAPLTGVTFEFKAATVSA